MTNPVDEPKAGGRSRRAFIKGAGGVIVAGLLAPIAVASLDSPHGNRGDGADRLPYLSHASFASQRGSRFRIRTAAAGTVNVTLTDVIQPEPRAAGASHGGEEFTLIFRGPLDKPLTQETYQFRHGNLGTFALFIVPGSPAQKGRSYAAVINRLPVEAPAG